MNNRCFLITALLMSLPAIASDLETEETTKKVLFGEEGLLYPYLDEKTAASIALVSKGVNARFEKHKADQFGAFVKAFPDHNPNRWISCWVKENDKKTNVLVPFSSLILDKSCNNCIGLKHNTVPLQQVAFPLNTLLKTEPRIVKDSRKPGMEITSEVLDVNNAELLSAYDADAHYAYAPMAKPGFTCMTNEKKDTFVVCNGSTSNNSGAVNNYRFFIGNGRKYLPVEQALRADKTPFMHPIDGNGVGISFVLPDQKTMGAIAKIFPTEYQILDQNYSSWQDKRNFNKEHLQLVAKKQAPKEQKSSDDTCVIS